MTRTDDRPANRLAKETSPYLLQHAHNPVDWYAWGAEAHERARREQKPILLSIGYATCHWCHVMERESFENAEIAAAMNARYVCIKVDREERPDVDEVYMAATIAMSGGGGWPMTVFLTPDLQPYFAGTYFPPAPRYGKPGFLTVLERLAEAWESEREDVVEQARRLTEAVAENADKRAPGEVGRVAFERALLSLEKSFDPRHGGFGGAPKFPHPRAIDFLFAEHARSPEGRAMAMARSTLDGMRRGGIYDHLAGGFARYSTDAAWHVPHFEKMLYDNAELARVYAESYAIGKSADDARVARETLDYLLREMTSPEGAFFSATDADSDGVEGKYFVWSLREIEELLPEADAALFAEAYDVSEGGNWEGHNVLRTPTPLAEVARAVGLDLPTLEDRLTPARRTLLGRRLERIPPITDDKVLVSWNALAIAAFAVAGLRLGEPRYVDAAARAASAIDAHLVRPDGGLHRTFRAGVAHLDAYLEDYAFLADALVDLYEASGNLAVLDRARVLAERMVADFGADDGGFYFTAASAETLLVRTSDATDNAIPSAQGVAARALARLGAHLGDDALTERAHRTVTAYGALAQRAPRAFLTLLSAADFLVTPPVEVAIAGPLDHPETVALRAAVAGVWLPHRVLAVGDDPRHPLLRDRAGKGDPPVAYVCRGGVCQLPTRDTTELVRLLEEARAASLRDRRDALAPSVSPS